MKKMIFNLLIIITISYLIDFAQAQRLDALNVNSSTDFQELCFYLGDKPPLSAILTIPNHTKKVPVVLLLQGSGSLDKDSTIFENKPFRDIAHGLAKKGIASLRYDKRFFAYPKQAQKLGANVNLKDEYLNDVSIAINILERNELIEAESIFVLGHSLAGGLTPAIAFEHNSINGIISMAGSLRPLYEISYDQNLILKESLDLSHYDEKTQQVLRKQFRKVEEDINILRNELEKTDDSRILLGLYAGYQKSLQKYSGQNFISKIDIPILVLHGSDDFQVFADKDFTLWEKTLENRKNAKLIIYEGLNHLMMPSNNKKNFDEYKTRNHVSEKVIDDIADFILQ